MSSCVEHSIDSSSSPSIERRIEPSIHRAPHRARRASSAASSWPVIDLVIELGSASSSDPLRAAIDRPASTSTPVDPWALALGLGECQLARRGTSVRPLFGGWLRPLVAPGASVAGFPVAAACFRFGPVSAAAASGGFAAGRRVFFGRFWPLNRFLPRFCFGLGSFCVFGLSALPVASGGLKRASPLFRAVSGGPLRVRLRHGFRAPVRADRPGLAAFGGPVPGPRSFGRVSPGFP